MKTRYEITVRIDIKKNYPVEAESLDEAMTKALEKAIQEYPGYDVWVE